MSFKTAKTNNKTKMTNNRYIFKEIDLFKVVLMHYGIILEIDIIFVSLFSLTVEHLIPELKEQGVVSRNLSKLKDWGLLTN